MLSGLPLAALLLAMPSPAPVHELPGIEIKGERWPSPSGPLPLSSTVLGPHQLEKQRGKNLAQILSPLAGLRMTARSGATSDGALSIRGSGPEHVVVLLDGRRLNHAQGGGPDLATISLESIESVEVLRGGASALFGPDALGGAIHLHSRSSRDLRTLFRAATGTAGLRDVSARGTFPFGNSGVVEVGGRSLDTAGSPAVPEGAEIESLENSDLEHRSLDARLEGRVSGWKACFGAGTLVADRGVPGSEEFPTPHARLADRRNSQSFRLELPGESHSPGSLDVSRAFSRRHYTDQGAPLGAIDETHENERREVIGESSWIRPSASARFAVGISQDHLESTTDGEHSRNAGFVRSNLVQDFDLAGHSLRALLLARLDTIETFRPRVSPRAGFHFDLAPSTLLFRASYGQAFRPPSFDDLFWPARASAAGNPDLREEVATDGDIGFTWTPDFSRGRLEVTGFHRKIRDLIQWIPGAGGIWRPHNVQKAMIRGIEALATAELLPMKSAGPLTLTLSATHLHTRDESGEPNIDGNRLVYRPPWAGAATLRLGRTRTLETEMETRFVGAVATTRANTVDLPGYAMTDVTFRRRIHTLIFEGRIVNCFDRASRDFADFPLPGRGFQFGVSWEGIR